jgi:hypothetical protein
MTKELNLGALKLSIPDYNTEVGKAIEALQNQYEAGNVRALLVVYATKDSIGSAVVGDGMVVPFVAMAASTVAGNTLDQIEDAFMGRQAGEDDE